MLIAPKPAAYFEPGAIAKLPDIVRGTGVDSALIVTDTALAATPVISRITGVLDAAGIPVRVFSGVHPNPTTVDLAAGADAVGGERVALVAVGGGSPIDAAKGIAIAAVNPQRGRSWTTKAGSQCGRCPSWRCRRRRAPGRRRTRSG